MNREELKKARMQRDLEEKEMLPPINEGHSIVFSAIAIVVMSVGFQILHWYLYEMFDFDMRLLCVTPLPLVLAYFAVMRDTGVGHTLPKRFIFAFACVVPLVLGLVLSVICYFNNPNLSIFTGEVSDADTKVNVTIALYSFRVALTSLYLTVCALLIHVFSKLKN